MNLDIVKDGLRIRSWKFHLIVLLFSLFVAALYSVIRLDEFQAADSIDLFIILFIQLEFFMAVAFRIFRRIETGTDRREITRIMLLKFATFMAICFLISLIIIVINVLSFNIIMGKDPFAAISAFFEEDFTSWMKQTVGGLMFGAAIFIFIQWQDALKREQKLREESLVFQNETLKNQVNPHFLFNSLNTLSSLITVNTEAADSFVRKLASIYRYILENSGKDRIPLQEELDYISNYCDLHKVRGEEKIILTINAPLAAKYEILPVSLQILVENSIKHNKATRDNPLMIDVTLEDDFIIVKNNLQPLATQLRSTGIGLKNLAERTKLVTGRSIVIEESKDHFTVKVPLLP